jgi:hypothetical protein
MEGSVTVDQAIRTAKWTIKRPMLFILLAVIFVKTIFYGIVYNQTVDTFLTIFVGLGLCWIYWSIAIPIWKIWAYTNVRNVHELKLKAQKCGFIFKDGNFFEKTEIVTYNQRETLKQLEKKFLLEDVYHDDPAIAKESKIYYSKIKLSFSFLFMSACFAALIYVTSDSNRFGKMDSALVPIIFLMGIFIYACYSDLKKLLNPNPQLTLSDKGIQLKDNPITSWQNIGNAIVYGQWSGKTYRKVLSFNGQEIRINDYNISMRELEELLHTYRVRYEKNNPIYSAIKFT